MHLIRPAWDIRWEVFYLVSLLVLSERLLKSFKMNFAFISVIVALTGLFGLAFAIYGVLTTNKGGRKGKPPSNQPSKDSSSNKKTFHRCSPPGCKVSIPGQDPHGQCFTCLTLDHNMNTCGPCLTSPADISAMSGNTFIFVEL